jgi:hypothetical protein
MKDEPGQQQLIAVSLERWRWEQILMCLDRYVQVLRGDYASMWDDVEWANQLEAMAGELRSLVNAGNDIAHAQHPVSSDGRPLAGTAEDPEPFEHQVHAETTTVRQGWSADENHAVIEAYFWMLDELESGREVNKAETYRTLRAGPLHLRSEGAIESKMQNISAVLDRHGIAFVRGLKPRLNVQGDLVTAVEEHLAARGMIDPTRPVG